MRRDLELIRKLILVVEDGPSGKEEILDGIVVEGYTAEQIGYHSYLVVDAGLAKGVDCSSLADKLPNWQILHLTSAGHDFADAARSDSTWNKAALIVKDTGSGVTIDVMKQVLITVVKNSLGL